MILQLNFNTQKRCLPYKTSDSFVRCSHLFLPASGFIGCIVVLLPNPTADSTFPTNCDGAVVGLGFERALLEILYS